MQVMLDRANDFDPFEVEEDEFGVELLAAQAGPWRIVVRAGDDRLGVFVGMYDDDGLAAYSFLAAPGAMSVPDTDSWILAGPLVGGDVLSEVRLDRGGELELKRSTTAWLAVTSPISDHARALVTTMSAQGVSHKEWISLMRP